MKELLSFLKPIIEQFVRYRVTSENWCSTYEDCIRYFDRFCKEQYPERTELKQDMIDCWCMIRQTETPTSRNARICVIRAFIKYLQERSLSVVKPPGFIKEIPSSYIPHSFSHKELSDFFHASDSLKPMNRTINSQARVWTVPVFFRLLYSSGIRTCEARLLLKENVDFNEGVLSITNSKGPHQHFVVLHDSMLALMVSYDREISSLVPNRKFFFPNGQNDYLTRAWVQYNFNALWKGCGFEYSSAYEIRHHYAVENINGWIGDPKFDTKFYYLSKSMGHAILESTCYYYSLVPKMANILQKTNEKSFNSIIPEVVDNE
jgi:site-specific recombinase XerD